MANRFFKYLADKPVEAGAALLKRPTAHRDPTADPEGASPAPEGDTYSDVQAPVRPENPALDMQEAPEEATPEGETLIESVADFSNDV